MKDKGRRALEYAGRAYKPWCECDAVKEEEAGRGRLGRAQGCGAACSWGSPALGRNGPALGFSLCSDWRVTAQGEHDLGSNTAEAWRCCGRRLSPALRGASVDHDLPRSPCLRRVSVSLH